MHYWVPIYNLRTGSVPLEYLCVRLRTGGVKVAVLCIDCVQHGERKLVVSIYVKQVVKDTLRIDFTTSSLTVTFQTRFDVQSVTNVVNVADLYGLPCVGYKSL